MSVHSSDNFARRLRYERERLGVTQTQLARVIARIVDQNVDPYPAAKNTCAKRIFSLKQTSHVDFLTISSVGITVRDGFGRTPCSSLYWICFKSSLAPVSPIS